MSGAAAAGGGAPSRSAGRPEKRRLITAAARRVFGAEGYARASVDDIAAEAGVSKRTVYNHFGDKESLFLAVALEGAHEVTATIARLLEKHLRKVVDVRDDLTAFALDRVAAVGEFPDHFALVRAIEAEAPRMPGPVLAAWIEAGPQTGHLRLAPYLAAMADRGLLTLDDAAGTESPAERAADHFNLLTVVNVNQRTFYGAVPLPGERVTELVVDGVRAFLRLYGAPPEPAVGHP
ncbi:TetR/AcrR family transcriptional regulator [Streptomyces hainanensis]|uniref:TetR/AcrR family transcriptional regulator n=1 Tax=Streptomyces hainanensis TaxID=402648 RepID=A0A4R4T9L4_9ACTN|nr:TetR/AcrR family transcriptional regulator [Streptomyces hainanensis]